MAKGGRGGRRSGASTGTSNANITATNAPRTYKAMDDTMAQQLRDDVDAMYTPSVRDAIKQYIANDTKNTGKSYSMSQSLNHKLDNNLPLNANEQYMVKYIQKGMHDIGSDVMLQRGCHENFLQDLGISNYANMTESQLKQQLVGTVYQTKSFSSFSYDVNKNPFLSGAQSGGREVVIHQKTSAGTKVVFGAKSQSEIITNIGTTAKITNVYFAKDANGKQKIAYPKNGGAKPVIIIETET